MSENPSFDALPGMVLGLTKEVAELKAILLTVAHKADTAPPPAEERFNGDRALADYLKCTVPTINKLKMKGKIPFHRFGRRYYYLRSEIDKALAGKHKVD